MKVRLYGDKPVLREAFARLVNGVPGWEFLGPVEGLGDVEPIAALRDFLKNPADVIVIDGQLERRVVDALCRGMSGKAGILILLHDLDDLSSKELALHYRRIGANAVSSWREPQEEIVRLIAKAAKGSHVSLAIVPR